MNKRQRLKWCGAEIMFRMSYKAFMSYLFDRSFISGKRLCVNSKTPDVYTDGGFGDKREKKIILLEDTVL